MQRLYKLGVFILILMSLPAQGKTVRYELTATQGVVNLSGKKSVDWALMLNGSIPAPTLEFTEGDDAEIIVTNHIPDQELSIHWHGILLPPDMDGVAYVNNPPIKSGTSFTFRFKIRQHGTYWYHSHTALQEQKGVYGGIIIHPKKRTIAYDRDVVVVLSDWSDENADQIIRNLRKDGDYYLYKKGTVRSIWGAMQADALGTYFHNEWTRMGGMDLSDVGYDAFLINGKRTSQLAAAMPGEKLRIRLINAAASSYFYVSLGQSPFKVISSDGMDIQPRLTHEILMGMAETYDILFEVPDSKSYELRATVQDVTGYASGWIGSGEKVPAPDKPMPDMYASMDHMGHGSSHEGHSMPGNAATPSAHHEEKGIQEKPEVDHSQHNMDHSQHGMDHSSHGSAPGASPSGEVVETLTVDHLNSSEKSAFAKTIPTHDVKLVLGGDMERYVWHINGKAIHQDRTITIREGEVVRFTFVNETMMHHPMHLHGHFFRVINAGGDFAPWKHTVDVPPHGTRVIEFLANEPGDWMLHCHNLYHMKTGMARVIKYSTFTPKPEIAALQKVDPHLHDHIYSDGMIELSSNHAQLRGRLSQTWNTLEAHAETRGYENMDHAEGAILYRRWFTNFLNLALGASYFAEYEEDKTRGVIGIGYTLPMLVETTLLVDHVGQLSLELEKKLQWTSRFYTDIDVLFRQEQKTEFEVSLMYAQAWSWSVGLMATEDDVGVGAQYRF